MVETIVETMAVTGWANAIPSELAAEMTPSIQAFVERFLARIGALKENNAELRRQLGQVPNTTIGSQTNGI